MSCRVCSELQANVEAAARELSRAVNDAKVAIHSISGVVAGNRIEDAERLLRSAGEELDAHKSTCEDLDKAASSAP